MTAKTGTGSDPIPAGRPNRPGRLVAEDVRVAFSAASRGAAPTVALDGLSLDVAGGEIVALIGPNGCGKSTFLRVAAGLLKPERGAITLDGRPIIEPDDRIGLVFQEPRLLPWRSAAANITYPLELAGWPAERRAARLAELLDAVGLEGAAGLRPVQMSGGMRQRAAIARSLALSPDVLLLDEPFSSLDALTRERFNLDLLRLQEQTGTTIVIVTHSIPEAILVADRVLVLTPRPGRVAAEVRIDAPRPRSLDLLDEAIVSRAAAEIRGHLELSEHVA
jgi:NitT/TauT family transport system ATP-binding protein